MAQQSSLFDQHTSAREVLPYGGSARYYPGAFSADASMAIMAKLIRDTEWKQEYVNFYGKRHPIPRETAWFGDSGAIYKYSKISNEPSPWTATLVEVKQKVELLAGVSFNSVLINRYRNGSDSVAWHSDDEPELGPQPVIGSVSFGATRTFQFKSNRDGEDRVNLLLESGSVLIMSGDSQSAWKHQIPKERSVKGERLNLTFRVISASSTSNHTV
jgi:alkylated DNA repair dioxygenase AlkB